MLTTDAALGALLARARTGTGTASPCLRRGAAAVRAPLAPQQRLSSAASQRRTRCRPQQQRGDTRRRRGRRRVPTVPCCCVTPCSGAGHASLHLVRQASTPRARVQPAAPAAAARSLVVPRPPRRLKSASHAPYPRLSDPRGRYRPL